MNEKQKELIEERLRVLRRKKLWDSFVCFGMVFAGICTVVIGVGIIFLIIAGVKGKRVRETTQEISRLEIELAGD